MKLKPTPAMLILLVILIALVIVEALELTGVISISERIYQNFDVFIFALVFISILSIIGAVFLGMFISHRIMSISAFTPFEEEMLKMREDIKDIKEMLKEKK